MLRLRAARQLFADLRNRQEGVTVIGYSLLVATVAVVIVVAVLALASSPRV